jgi:hypothetical protein
MTVESYPCTFIHGGSAHPREYTFGHGWARAELRASQTVHTSPYGKAVFVLLFFRATKYLEVPRHTSYGASDGNSRNCP